MLSLLEQLFILSIHEEKGTVLTSAEACLPYGLGGAILMELALSGKIKISDNHRVVLFDKDPTGEDVLDNAQNLIANTEKDKRVGYWVETLSDDVKKLRKRLADVLVDKNIATQEDKRLLWVITNSDEPEANGSEKYRIKRHLRGIILACSEAELRDIALLWLLLSTNLLEIVFMKDERKLAARRIHALLLAEALKNTTIQEIEEIGNAVASNIED